jgi:hypothetical protein
MKNFILKKMFEEAPVVNIGSGNVAGAGVDAPGKPGSGEPGIKKKKSVTLLRRNLKEIIEYNDPYLLFEELTDAQKRQVDSWQKTGAAELISRDAIKEGDKVILDLDDGSEPVQPSAKVMDYLRQAGIEVMDYKSGLAKKVGDKNIMRIGKLFNKLNTPVDIRKEYENDPARATANKPVSDLKIIITRNPYDVAGMSTDREWRSCMNMVDGMYRSKLEYDIKHGTHVAYLVSQNDLEIKNPLARIALKPFVETDTAKAIADRHTILVPENRMYTRATPPTAFQYTVNKWAKTHFPAKDDVIYGISDELYNDSGRSMYASPTTYINRKRYDTLMAEYGQTMSTAEITNVFDSISADTTLTPGRKNLTFQSVFQSLQTSGKVIPAPVLQKAFDYTKSVEGTDIDARTFKFAMARMILNNANTSAETKRDIITNISAYTNGTDRASSLFQSYFKKATGPEITFGLEEFKKYDTTNNLIRSFPGITAEFGFDENRNFTKEHLETLLDNKWISPGVAHKFSGFPFVDKSILTKLLTVASDAAKTEILKNAPNIHEIYEDTIQNARTAIVPMVSAAVIKNPSLSPAYVTKIVDNAFENMPKTPHQTDFWAPFMTAALGHRNTNDEAGNKIIKWMMENKDNNVSTRASYSLADIPVSASFAFNISPENRELLFANRGKHRKMILRSADFGLNDIIRLYKDSSPYAKDGIKKAATEKRFSETNYTSVINSAEFDGDRIGYIADTFPTVAENLNSIGREFVDALFTKAAPVLETLPSFAGQFAQILYHEKIAPEARLTHIKKNPKLMEAALNRGYAISKLELEYIVDENPALITSIVGKNTSTDRALMNAIVTQGLDTEKITKFIKAGFYLPMRGLETNAFIAVLKSMHTDKDVSAESKYRLLRSILSSYNGYSVPNAALNDENLNTIMDMMDSLKGNTHYESLAGEFASLMMSNRYSTVAFTDDQATKFFELLKPAGNDVSYRALLNSVSFLGSGVAVNLLKSLMAEESSSTVLKALIRSYNGLGNNAIIALCKNGFMQYVKENFPDDLDGMVRRKTDQSSLDAHATLLLAKVYGYTKDFLDKTKEGVSWGAWNAINEAEKKKLANDFLDDTAIPPEFKIGYGVRIAAMYGYGQDRTDIYRKLIGIVAANDFDHMNRQDSEYLYSNFPFGDEQLVANTLSQMVASGKKKGVLASTLLGFIKRIHLPPNNPVWNEVMDLMLDKKKLKNMTSKIFNDLYSHLPYTSPPILDLWEKIIKDEKLEKRFLDFIVNEKNSYGFSFIFNRNILALLDTPEEKAKVLVKYNTLYAKMLESKFLTTQNKLKMMGNRYTLSADGATSNTSIPDLHEKEILIDGLFSENLADRLAATNRISEYLTYLANDGNPDKSLILPKEVIELYLKNETDSGILNSWAHDRNLRPILADVTFNNPAALNLADPYGWRAQQQRASYQSPEVMEKARRMGLSYYSFGRYGREIDGVKKVTHIAVRNDLVPYEYYVRPPRSAIQSARLMRLKRKYVRKDPNAPVKPKRKYVRKDPNAPVREKRKYVRKDPNAPVREKRKYTRRTLVPRPE